MAVDKVGSLWVTGYGGENGYVFERWPDLSWHSHLIGQMGGTPNIGFDVDVDKDGRVAVATLSEARILAPGVGWEIHDGLSDVGGMAVSVTFDSSGRLWVGSDASIRVLHLDGRWEAFELDPITGLGWAVLAAGDGRIFAGFNYGLVRLEPEGRAQWFRIRDGLPGDPIRRIAFDARGDAWIQSFRQSPAHLSDREHWTHHDRDPAFQEHLPTDLDLDPEGRPWVSLTFDGLVHQDGQGRWRQLDEGDGLPSGMVNTLRFDKAGVLWVGHSDLSELLGRPPGGLSRRGPDGDWQHWTETEGLISNDVTRLAPDGAGGAWAGHSGDGLSHVSVDGHVEQHSVAATGMLADTVLALTVAEDGRVWAGTPSGALHRAPGGSWEALTVEDGLPSNEVYSITVEPGIGIWFGTDTGAALRTNEGSWTYYRREDGLIGNNVGGVFVDSLGNVWFTHVRGGVAILDAGRRKDRGRAELGGNERQALRRMGRSSSIGAAEPVSMQRLDRQGDPRNARDLDPRNGSLHKVRLRLGKEQPGSTVGPPQPPHRPIRIADQVELAGGILGKAADVQSALQLESGREMSRERGRRQRAGFS
jgi:ligand-binding sensor domain-containing protein